VTALTPPCGCCSVCIACIDNALLAGLLSVTASATQMMRQSLLPIAALFGVGCWHKRLNAYHITGLLGCVVSVSCFAGYLLRRVVDCIEYIGGDTKQHMSSSTCGPRLDPTMLLLCEVSLDITSPTTSRV
jgi:hypothetical protein